MFFIYSTIASLLYIYLYIRYYIRIYTILCSYIYDTIATQGRVFGKRGASGGYCLGINQLGIGCAIKVDDGSEVQYTVALKCLDWLEIYLNKSVLNNDDKLVLEAYETKISYDYCNVKVGSMRVSSQIFKGKYISGENRHISKTVQS